MKDYSIRLALLNPTKISHLAAEINYTHIYFTNGTKDIISVNIGKVAEALNFTRLNKSVAVNPFYISMVERDTITMRSGFKAKVSRRRAAILDDLLKSSSA